MEETALSVEVRRDPLPEWNRMVDLPESDDINEEDKRLALGARLRVWRGEELRRAVEAEIAGAVEAGEVAATDAAGMIDRVCLILASDASIADPPSRGSVEHVLEHSRMKLRGLLCPRSVQGNIEAEPCPYDFDQYGNFPGVNWREVLDWGLSRACRWHYPKQPVATSYQIAWKILRDEVTRDAEAVAAGEEAERRKRSDLAVASLPVVFDGDQQGLLSFLRRLHAGGDFVEVPTDGNPVAEAELLRQVRAFDIYEMTPSQQAEVAGQLMRAVATAEAAAAGPLIVPGLGYAIKVEGRKIIDVFPGNLSLVIQGREHVLASPELSRPVRLSAKEYRDPRLCAIAIYEQALIEVDNPRGHWRRWWPVLAERLRKAARIVEDADRGMEWERFKAGVIAAAVESLSALKDGSPYRCSRGTFVGKEWLARKAVEAGVISESEKRTFLAWLGEAKPEYDDAGGRHKRLRLAGPLCVEGTFEPVEKIAVPGTGSTNDP